MNALSSYETNYPLCYDLQEEYWECHATSSSVVCDVEVGARVDCDTGPIVTCLNVNYL
jgi:hypothetical protein